MRSVDITINALYWHPIFRELYDPFHGGVDQGALIRFIGDPPYASGNDALRLLRAVRFRALIAGQYYPDTYRALTELAQLVESLSGNRCLREIGKMLLGPQPERAFEDLWRRGS